MDDSGIQDASGGSVRRSLSAGGVAKVGVIVYVLAALLNSTDLLGQAERMPLSSSTRGMVLPLARNLNTLSGTLHFDEPGRKVDELRGIKVTAEPGTAFGPSTTSTSGSQSPDTTVAGQQPPAATVPVTEPPPTAPPVTVPSVPTKSNPLKIYIGGDSLVQGWGAVLQRLSVSSRLVDAPAVDYRAATGLARPDSFDWPTRLVQQMTAVRPQVAVVGFGGNDGQGLVVSGRAFQPGAPEWAAEYGRRVGETMDYLLRDGRKLIWVGTPMPENAKDFAHQEIINQIFRIEVAKRPSVTLVDTWVLFESPDHTYAAYMVDDDGVAKLMRQGDGFHLSVAGAERLGRAVFAKLQDELAARGASI